MAEKQNFYSKTYKFSGGRESKPRPDVNVPNTKTESGNPAFTPQNIAIQGGKKKFTPKGFSIRNP